MEQQGEPIDESDNSLEGSSTVVESNNGDVAPIAPTPNNSPDSVAQPPQSTAPPVPVQPIKAHHHLFNFVHHLNVYLLSFIIIFIIAIVIAIVAITNSHNSSATTSTSISALTQSQLEKIANSSSTTSVGTANQVLNIAASTIFSGQVLIRQNLDVAGSIKIGGSINLPAISVMGTGTFQTLQTSKLTVTGDSGLQGNVNIGQALTVAGATTFSGAVSANQLTVQTLNLNGDIVIDHHIDTGGLSPTRTPGNALGNGGTVSVNGSDTAGTITINTGSSPAVGCFVTVTFGKAFTRTPSLAITPVDVAASGLAYYVTRTTTDFSVCTSSTPPAGQTFGYDYIAIE
jgi:cytoskeletal protein CcmA (bactofilin family)